MPSLAEEVAAPEFSLYGDGRALVRQDLEGAYPQIVELQLDRHRIDDLFERAAESGVFAEPSVDTDAVDAGELRITVRSPEREYVAVVHGDSAEDDEMAELADELRDLGMQGRRYEPERIGIFFRPVETESRSTKTWPLRSPASTGGRHPCVTVQGQAVDAAARLARTSAPETRWRADGRVFTVNFRSLLPEEPDCGAATPGA